jgi:hypothetical protein
MAGRAAALLLVSLFLGLCGTAGGFAVETAAGTARVAEFDPLPLLGMDTAAAFSAFGPPREVFPVRGAEQGEDDVVFFYDSCLYLFWFRSRVWQVRFDRRFDGRVLGLAIGMSRTEVGQACARSLQPAGDSVYFDVMESPYPVRVRLVFDSEALSDIYVYRSDY